VIALHVSDNLGKSDDHNIPGRGNINWKLFISTLKLIDYKGVFVLELLEQGKGWDCKKVLKEAFRSVALLPSLKG